MLAKMALRLSHTTCEVAVFSGGYWTQVSDLDLTSFLLQTLKTGALNTFHTHGIFSMIETHHMLEGFGRMGGFGWCWHFPSWLTRKKGQMIYTVNDDKIWIVLQVL